MKQLILILTYNCNLNCKYCPTIKTNKSINLNTAKKAINLTKPDEIKFFGGEPLLKWNLIKKIVNNTKCKYELTTNGILLNKQKLEFMKKNKFELRISIDGKTKTQKTERGIETNKLVNMLKEYKNYVIINMVISPNNVNKFYENFNYLYLKGFVKFNFLPAFYNKWNKENIILLKKQLFKIIPLIKKNKEIYIKNKDINKKTYLFNEGIVVDTNGDIFKTNNIMIKPYYSNKECFKLGNVLKINNLNELKKSKGKIIENNINDKYHIINLKIDSILTEFVKSL
jgi:sulfatase maturation enzyme AslB (radical SAM superfamily)